MMILRDMAIHSIAQRIDAAARNVRWAAWLVKAGCSRLWRTALPKLTGQSRIFAALHPGYSGLRLLIARLLKAVPE
jgi:hypothetical protein